MTGAAARPAPPSSAIEGGDDPLVALAATFPTSVTITRTSAKDCQTRQVIVSLDGQRVATLLWGDTVRCDLAPGRHTLRAYNTLVWKTVEFTLRPGEQAFYEVVNRNGVSTFLMVAFLGVGPLFVDLRRM